MSRAVPGSGTRLLVLSPHLDDAVLSIGATMAHLAQRGVGVQVLTVFGGDPDRSAAPGDSNLRAGFTTTGEAATARRAEDDLACAALGVGTVRLPFDDDEASPRRADAIGEALEPFLADADTVLLPGSPLQHPDHLLVARVAADHAPEDLPAGLYLEQPYAAWHWLSRSSTRPWKVGVPPAPPVLPAGRGQPHWQRSGACPACRRRKFVAAGAYRSQLRVLRRWPRGRVVAYELLAGGERVAWPTSVAEPPYIGSDEGSTGPRSAK